MQSGLQIPVQVNTRQLFLENAFRCPHTRDFPNGTTRTSLTNFSAVHLSLHPSGNVLGKYYLK